MGSFGQVGGSFLSALGSIYSGIEDSNVANTEAAQLRINAGQAFAAGTSAAEVARQRGAYVQSAATAAAGASGAGGGDPTVQNIKAEIGRATQYNALEAIYQGKSTQQQLNEQADLTQFAGQQAQTAGYVNAFTNFPLSSSQQISNMGTDLLSKYGGDLPPWMGGSAGGGDNSLLGAGDLADLPAVA